MPVVHCPSLVLYSKISGCSALLELYKYSTGIIMGSLHLKYLIPKNPYFEKSTIRMLITKVSFLCTVRVGALKM